MLLAALSPLLWVLPKCFDILSICALCWPAPPSFFGFRCPHARGVKFPRLSRPERSRTSASTVLGDRFSPLGGPAPPPWSPVPAPASRLTGRPLSPARRCLTPQPTSPSSRPQRETRRLGLPPPYTYMPGPDLMPFFRHIPYFVLREDPGGSPPGDGTQGRKNFKPIFGRGKPEGAGPHNGRKKALYASGGTISLWPDISRGGGVYFGGGPGPGTFLLQIAPGGENEGEMTGSNLP